MKRYPSVPVPLPSGLYYGWVIVAVALITNMATSPTNAVIFSFFVGPMGDDLGWSRGAISWAMTVRLLAAGVSGPLVGVLVDRIGGRWLGVGAGIIAGLCVIGLGFITEYWMLLALTAVSGLSGFCGPASSLLTIVPVSKWFHTKRGRAVAIASLGMAVGTMLFIPFVQWMITMHGWRTAWVVCGVLVIIPAVPLCWLFMRREPEDLGLLPDGATTPPQALPQSVTMEVTSHDWTVRQTMHTRAMWLILTAMLFSGLAVQGALLYRVSFWREIGMSPSWVAFGTALDPFTIIFSGLAFGILAERLSVRLLGLIGGMGIGLSMLPMIFAQNHPFYITAHGVLWGGFMGANIASNNLMLPNYFGRKNLGAIRGIVLPAMITASAIGAPVFGYLLDSNLSTQVVWSIALFCFAVSGVLIYLAKPPRLPTTDILPSAKTASEPLH